VGIYTSSFFTEIKIYQFGIYQYVVPPESEFNSFQEAVRIAKSSDSKTIFPIRNNGK